MRDEMLGLEAREFLGRLLDRLPTAPPGMRAVNAVGVAHFCPRCSGPTGRARCWCERCCRNENRAEIARAVSAMPSAGERVTRAGVALRLSVRSAHRVGHLMPWELAAMSDQTLLAINGLGAKSVREIREVLSGRW